MMRKVASWLRAPEPAASPAARWTTGAALAGAATLVIADVFQLASHIVEPTKTEAIDRLEWIAANPDQATAAKSLDLLALPFLLGTTLVYVLLSRERSRRLANWGGILLATGLVGLSAVEGFETLLFILVDDGRVDLSTLADVAENDMASGPGLVMLLLFLPPALIGLLMLGVALWRSRAAPRGAVVLIVGALLVVDVVLFESLGVVPHWAPHVVGLVASIWLAWAVLDARRTRPAAEP